MKPVENNISPYLQQPLRTLDEVRQERERRQQEQAAATQTAATTQPEPAAANQNTAPANPSRVDQTI